MKKKNLGEGRDGEEGFEPKPKIYLKRFDFEVFWDFLSQNLLL